MAQQDQLIPKEKVGSQTKLHELKDHLKSQAILFLI